MAYTPFIDSLLKPEKRLTRETEDTLTYRNILCSVISSARFYKTFIDFFCDFQDGSTEHEPCQWAARCFKFFPSWRVTTCWGTHKQWMVRKSLRYHFIYCILLKIFIRFASKRCKKTFSNIMEILRLVSKLHSKLLEKVFGFGSMVLLIADEICNAMVDYFYGISQLTSTETEKTEFHQWIGLYVL